MSQAFNFKVAQASLLENKTPSAAGGFHILNPEFGILHSLNYAKQTHFENQQNRHKRFSQID